MTELEKFRSEKDDFYKTSSESPLKEEQKADFSGLKYYPENPELVFDLPIDKNIEGETLLPMQTSAGDSETYKRYGRINFQVSGQDAVLTVFKDINDSSLFLPFRDSTAGTETYGSGRYVEVEEVDGKLKVDFNYAYSPNCAYNEQWRCPIPPVENKISVPIEAGEKKFHD